MSDIEMPSLRANLHGGADTDTSGDSSTAQDRLLNHHNGHNNNHYHHHHHGGGGLSSNNGLGGGGVGNQHYATNSHNNSKQHPPPSYALGAPRPRPVTGSGVVFRRKRKPCWCVLLVVVAVALLAAGISLGVLFGVMKTGQQDRREGAPHIVGNGMRNGSSSSNTHSTSSSSLPGGGDGDSNSKHVTESPTPTSSSSTPGATPDPRAPPPGGRGGGQTKPSSSWGVSVRRFKAHWHPGDSRVMDILLSNGTMLQATGHKSNDGTFRGLYSLILTDKTTDKTTRVRFMGGRSLASVILPDGTVVSLDWSANGADLECKVFQIPPPRGAPGAGTMWMPDGSPMPTSHLATLKLGVHSYLLRQISRTLNEASAASPGVWEEEEEEDPMSPPLPKFCAPRLPVKVTKCGGQYPYDGAFVQGEITLQTGPPLKVAALPWHRQDDDDECYGEFKDSSPNFFIPLPGHVGERRQAHRLAARFWRTASRWWARVCDVVGTVLEVDLERHKVCSNMAASAQTQLKHGNLYRAVHDSCSALLTSLHLACRTLDDLTARAASQAASSGGWEGTGPSRDQAGGGAAANSGGSGNSASGGGGGSRQPAGQEILQKVFADATSLQEPATAEVQEVQVKTFAFCPSTQPLSSSQVTLTLHASGRSQEGGGGVSSRDVTAGDLVRVNCLGPPEVTYFYLGHAAAIEPLNMVKHRLKVCAVCASEKTFSVHVREDHMCCTDNCTKEQRCEDSISDSGLGLGLKERHTFRQPNSVYCHEFLTAADTPTRALPKTCLGTCQSNLEVRFQVKDAEAEEGGVATEGGRVYLDQVLTCLEGSRSTCKSTFGH